MKLIQDFIEYGVIETDNIIQYLEPISKDNIWNDQHRAKTYSAQANTQTISFVWTPIIYNVTTFSSYQNDELLNTPLGKEYLKITDQVLKLIPGKILRGAIVRMLPGTEIPFHIDGKHELWHQCNRVHLPIITEPEIEFFYKHTRKHLRKDTLVEIRNDVPHGVSHRGKHLRYHFMYDILPENYIGKFNVEYHSDINRFNLDKEIESSGSSWRSHNNNNK